jgi:phosphatidylglycerol:prolipoprotein diacylglycerol transferase
MRQILFYVPFTNIPLYGYGVMLLLAYLVCSWLAARLARREGFHPDAVDSISELTMWLFFGGILGARITYVARYWDTFADFTQMFAFYDGGLIFYGSIPGALVAYALFYLRHLRKHGVSNWKMADVVAPCLAVGLCLGRVGCLLNGCCYGNVACASCPAVSFPLPSTPRYDMVKRGYQTPAGFVTQQMPLAPVVLAVEPNSAVAAAGLKKGDRITAVNGKRIETYGDLALAFSGDPEHGWRRGDNTLQLDVVGADGQARALPPVTPRGIGLHPTQLYETISMALLLFFLLSYYPFKTHDGALMVLFMFGYGVHRFVNEMLRTDTEIVAFGMTLSQNISVVVLGSAALLAILVWRRPALANGPASPPTTEVPAQATVMGG